MIDGRGFVPRQHMRTLQRPRIEHGRRIGIAGDRGRLHRPDQRAVRSRHAAETERPNPHLVPILGVGLEPSLATGGGSGFDHRVRAARRRRARQLELIVHSAGGTAAESRLQSDIDGSVEVYITIELGERWACRGGQDRIVKITGIDQLKIAIGLVGVRSRDVRAVIVDDFVLIVCTLDERFVVVEIACAGSPIDFDPRVGNEFPPQDRAFLEVIIGRLVPLEPVRFRPSLDRKASCLRGPGALLRDVDRLRRAPGAGRAAIRGACPHLDLNCLGGLYRHHELGIVGAEKASVAVDCDFDAVAVLLLRDVVPIDFHEVVELSVGALFCDLREMRT